MTVVRGSCHHDCPDTCVWDVTVTDGKAVQLRGNADHPTTQGQLCPKVNRFLDRVYHPDRILTPLRRVGPKGSGGFEPISWAAALDEIADNLRSRMTDAGAPEVLQFSFDGTQGVIQKGVLADRFFDAIGASDIDRHLCGVTAWLGAADVSGIPYSLDPEDLQHSDFIILWGTNTLLTNRHLWPTIQAARSRGATVVTIDPFRTATAAQSDHFLQIRPGTDVALVLAMVHVIDRDGLVDDEWMGAHTDGWPALQEDARAMTPERASAATGIESGTIEWLATSYATRRPAAIRVLVGPEHRRRGRETMRAIAMLPAVTGAWRDVGGGLARSTQAYFETALNYPTDRPRRRTFNMAELGRVLTDASLEPPISMLFVHNSNPAVIVPDQAAVIQGLERADLFTVVAEQFLTDTARYADIVLPATTQLEHHDLGIAWGHLYLSLNQPAIEPLGEAVPNTELFRRLATVLELDDPRLHTSDDQLMREMLDSDHPWVRGITLEQLQRDGWARLHVDPGHRPNVDRQPNTDSGRLQLGALDFADTSEAARGALQLLSPKHHTRFLNANYGGFDAHLPASGEPVVMLHPEDAQTRGLEGGDRAVIANERGSLTLTVEVTDDVRPGCAAIPFGWWHRHAAEGATVNVLTNPELPADGQGSAAFLDTWVDVARAPIG